MKLIKIIACLITLVLVCGCVDRRIESPTTEQQPEVIEYHDKYIDLKSGERLYYRYRDIPMDLLGRVFYTNLDGHMNSYPLVARVLLKTVRTDASLAPGTFQNRHNRALAYEIQIQEIYRQDASWTDEMTEEVNSGLVYSNLGDLILGAKDDGNPLLYINVVIGLDSIMLLEDKEYYVAIEKIEDYYFVTPIGEVNVPFPNQSPLITAWGEQVEIEVQTDAAPELWDVNSGKMGMPNTIQFQAYVRYTLKDEECYQAIKDNYPITYEDALNVLNALSIQ